MKKIIFILLSVLCLSIPNLRAQDQKEINEAIYNRVAASVQNKVNLPTGELALEIAKNFLGTPYVAFTLEVVPESLQVFLDKTDCILFVELCSCMALTLKGEKIVQGSFPEYTKPSYALLCHNIQNMRYRKGVVDGYASRCHYTSEWLIQAAGNHVLYEYTSSLGKLYDQEFSFMSSHHKSYPQLIDDAVEAAKVARTEQWLNGQGPYWIISQEDLFKDEIISQIKDGDIITFISTQKGLDLTVKPGYDEAEIDGQKKTVMIAKVVVQ